MKKFRLSRVSKRFVQEREKKGHTLGNLYIRVEKWSKPENSVVMSNSKIVQGLLNMEFARKKACDLHKNIQFIVDSGASLHMMSKNELTSSEKDTIRKSKEPTVIMTANGRAEPMEELYADDLDVLAIVILLED